MTTLFIAWLLAAAGAEAAEPPVCPEQAKEALVDAARDVEQAWLHLDESGFDRARARLGRLQLCIDRPLSREDVLALHRARGLLAFVDGDLDASKRAFAAVYALQPSWEPPERLVPREHPLWRVFDAAVDAEPRFVPFRTAPEHGWSIDGLRFPDPAKDDHALADALPGHRAFVLQVFDASDDVTYTGYHLSTTDIPLQDLLDVPGDELGLRRRRQARTWGTVVGGAMLAAGAVTFGLSWNERTKLQNGEIPLEEVESTQTKANTLGGVSYGLAGGGAVLVGVSWAVPW